MLSDVDLQRSGSCHPPKCHSCKGNRYRSWRHNKVLDLVIFESQSYNRSVRSPLVTTMTIVALAVLLHLDGCSSSDGDARITIERRGASNTLSERKSSIKCSDGVSRGMVLTVPAMPTFGRAAQTVVAGHFVATQVPQTH